MVSYVIAVLGKNIKPSLLKAAFLMSVRARFV